MEDGIELGVEIVEGSVVEDIVVSGGDGATFFDVFDFAAVAFADFGGSEGALGAVSEAFVAKVFGSDNGDGGHLAGKFMFDGFVFGPGVKSIEDNTLLAGGDEIFNLGGSLTSNPVLTFGGADFFAELCLAFGSDFNAALFHFFINHAAKVDFGGVAFGEIIDDD